MLFEFLVSLLVTIALCGGVFYVLWWAIGQVNLGEPWTKLFTIALVIAVVITALAILLEGWRVPVPGLALH